MNTSIYKNKTMLLALIIAILVYLTISSFGGSVLASAIPSLVIMAGALAYQEYKKPMSRRNMFQVYVIVAVGLALGYLALLFSSGIFTPSKVHFVCSPGPRYSCSEPTIGSNGNVSFVFGQSTGITLYNIGMACSSTFAATGLPNPPTAMVYLSSSGKATTTGGQAGGSLSLSNGTTVSVSGLKCFGTNANAITGPDFEGYLWVNYTINSGPPVAGNPILTTRFAAVGRYLN